MADLVCLTQPTQQADCRFDRAMHHSPRALPRDQQIGERTLWVETYHFIQAKHTLWVDVNIDLKTDAKRFC